MNEKVLKELQAEAHADYAPQYAVGRDLYRLVDGSGKDATVVAFISAYDRARVLGKYIANGGKQNAARLLVERIGLNVPADVTKIYA